MTVDALLDLSHGLSTYHYAFNNPMRYLDPSGLQGEEPSKIYELPEVVVTAQGSSLAMLILVGVGEGFIETPNPWVFGAGMAILGGIATYQFLQPFLSEGQEIPDGGELKKTLDLKRRETSNLEVWMILHLLKAQHLNKYERSFPKVE